MLRATLAAGAVLAAAIAPAAQPVARVVAVYDGRVTFELPPDWHEIGAQELEDATSWTAEATGGRLVEWYRHGFRPAAAAADHGLPQLMVQIRESGRLPAPMFFDLPPLETLQDGSRSAFPAAVPPLIVGLRLEDASFDRDRLVLRLEHRLDLRLVGEIRVLTAAFLTERGWFILHLTDRRLRIDASRELFDGIVDSVRFDRTVAYSPRVTDRWPGLPFFVAAALTASVLAVWLVRRRRHRT